MHPKTLNARLYSPFTAFILKMRTEVYTKIIVQFQDMVKPQKRWHT
jgi:hypothetical protein